jgi:hypothetical protein
VTGSTWLTDLVAATMLATALYCVGRIVIARARALVTETDVDLVHVAMGLGMADMLLRPPGSAVNRIGAVGFGAATGYFAFRSLRQYAAPRSRPVGLGHHLQHALGSGAMLFMFLPGSHTAMTSSISTMSAPSGLARVPPTAGLLALLLLGLALATAGRLVSSVGAPTGATPAGWAAATERAAGPTVLAPRLAICCQVLMSASMCYALLVS